MNQIVDQIVTLLQQGVAAILKFLQLVWTWSFGQIVGVFQSDWQSLPAWKLLVLVLILAGVAYLLYLAATRLWEATEQVFKSFVVLLTAFVTVLPYIVAAGALSFGGGWVIRTVDLAALAN